MKKIVILVTILILYFPAVNAFAVTGDIYPYSPDFVIVGEVVEIGEAKDSVYPFQMVRYKVNKVCKGEYKNHEILVYHIFETVTDIVLKVGDERVLPVTKHEGLLERAEKINDRRWATEYFVMEGLIIPDCKIE